ncbi:MAG TPA: class I SAM-dependent methyltransferase [Thermomicrobiaceae bacterium]|nr:class I SAM-dependent methyltransferase [Thermomicrobiaceae bacterium]
MIQTEPSQCESLVNVACDLCGSRNAEPIVVLRDLISGMTNDTFQLVRCRECGHRYLNPRPADPQLTVYYPDDYAPFGQYGLSARIKRFQRRRLIRRNWSLLGPPARVLDVGCATGELLASIRALGNPHVAGIEPSERAAEIARRRRGLDVRTGTLESAQIAPESFDVVLMSHTIEHLPSPSRTLGEIERVLSPGAYLFLWLPNADSWSARVFGRYWIGYDAPRHLHAFSTRTLTRLLARHGFAVEALEHEAIGLEWSWGLRLIVRRRFGRGRLDRGLEKLHPLLTALATPISWLAARSGRAGRIFVLARKIEKP